MKLRRAHSLFRCIPKSDRFNGSLFPKNSLGMGLWELDALLAPTLQRLRSKKTSIWMHLGHFGSRFLRFETIFEGFLRLPTDPYPFAQPNRKDYGFHLPAQFGHI